MKKKTFQTQTISPDMHFIFISQSMLGKLWSSWKDIL